MPQYSDTVIDIIDKTVDLFLFLYVSILKCLFMVGSLVKKTMLRNQPLTNNVTTLSYFPDNIASVICLHGLNTIDITRIFHLYLLEKGATSASYIDKEFFTRFLKDKNLCSLLVTFYDETSNMFIHTIVNESSFETSDKLYISTMKQRTQKVEPNVEMDNLLASIDRAMKDD